MPKFKEKPKGKVRRSDKSSMLSPRQAAKLLKDRYVQQLDQKQANRESEATYAVDRVEDAGRTAVEEVKDRIHAPSPRQRERPIKERPRQGTAKPEDTLFSSEGLDHLTREGDAGTTAVPKEHRAEFKARQTARGPIYRSHRPGTPRFSGQSIHRIHLSQRPACAPARRWPDRLHRPAGRRPPMVPQDPDRPAGIPAGRENAGREYRPKRHPRRTWQATYCRCSGT